MSLAAIHDVHLPITLTALAAISHGAGTSGNTQLLRTRDVIAPDGTRSSVPYISGNSLRHTLRDALAWHLVRTLDVPEYSLPKRVVDLLWSGGALSTTGSQVDLAQSARIHTLTPGLGLLGYSAKSDITAGTLWVDDVELVCAENTHRLPGHLQDHPHTQHHSGAMRTETFGTRHDIEGTPVDRYIDLATGGNVSTQMIYDMQVLRPGSVLYTSLHLAAPTAGHALALATAVDCAMPVTDGRRVVVLGGKRAVGYGSCAVDADWTPLGDIETMRHDYETHLASHRDEVLALLNEATR